MQKIDELAKVASTANEETSAVKARVRGQQNRVAELEKQVAIMKQVEDGRKKELGETRQQNVVLQRQNTDLEAKIVNWETEVTGLRREMATINVENTQLRAAVVQRVLSTPKSQGPEPASDSAAKREEDF
jgi:chromosome segregation ATPase